MAKKRKVEKESKAIAKIEGVTLQLREEADLKTYRKALDTTNKIAGEMREGLKKHSRSSLTQAWDIGDIWKSFFLNAKSQFGVISNAVVDAICHDLDPTEKGRVVAVGHFRHCLKLANSYTRERVIELVELGFTNNHFQALLKLVDDKARAKYEADAISNHLSGDDLNKKVKALAHTPAGKDKVAEGTRKKFEKNITQKKNQLEKNPEKYIGITEGKIESFKDVLTDFFTIVRNLKNSGDDKAKAHLKKPITKVMELLEEVSGTIDEITTDFVDTYSKTVEAKDVSEKTKPKVDKKDPEPEPAAPAADTQKSPAPAPAAEPEPPYPPASDNKGAPIMEPPKRKKLVIRG